MGLEAISRGAKAVVQWWKKIEGFLNSLNRISIPSTVKIEVVAIQGDALSSIPLLRVPRPVDITFVDPPFAMMKPKNL